MKHILLSVFMIITFANLSQAQLNDYKYIVVPKRFENFKQENQYLTSTLIKHLFTENGFNTVYKDALPDDLYGNPCMGLSVRLDDASSMFSTKTTLVLLDCNGQEIFMTQEGKSKKKEYKAAYNEAITRAFESFQTLNYSYTAKAEEPVTVSFKDDVKELKEENTEEKPKFDKYQDPMVEQEATPEDQSYKNREPVPSDYKKEEAAAGKVTQQVATEEVQRFKTMEPVPSDIVKAESPEPESGADTADVLYAQKIANGYQLVDSTPKIVLKILETSVPDVYTVELEKGNGVVYKKDGKWFYEYYVGDELTVKELNIKF